jgi:hypothetical protein
VKLAGLVFSGVGLSIELSPPPHPASITENKPVNNAIKMNLALFMTLLLLMKGINALVLE